MYFQTCLGKQIITDILYFVSNHDVIKWDEIFLYLSGRSIPCKEFGVFIVCTDILLRYIESNIPFWNKHKIIV